MKIDFKIGTRYKATIKGGGHFDDTPDQFTCLGVSEDGTEVLVFFEDTDDSAAQEYCKKLLELIKKEGYNDKKAYELDEDWFEEIGYYEYRNKRYETCMGYEVADIIELEESEQKIKDKILTVRVLTTHPLSEEEINKEILEAENRMNSKGRVRFHIEKTEDVSK